ncbi:MAG: histidine triad nucleotide-binding protein [Bacteroidales bacterium]|nr:histidine triad nucleotide-binding protein [Bacteroidales bacterium]
MNKNRCIFCDIVANKLNADIVYRSDSVIAFKDIHPKAPVHILIIPKEHIPTLNDLKPNHQNLIGEIFLAAQQIAKEFGLAENGYRTVFNCNRDAGQEVYHIHLHLLGGRQFHWPPG